MLKGIKEFYKYFATGSYALWYPVVIRQQIKRMLKEVEATGIHCILQIKLAAKPDSNQRSITVSAIIFINPP